MRVGLVATAPLLLTVALAGIDVVIVLFLDPGVDLSGYGSFLGTVSGLTLNLCALAVAVGVNMMGRRDLPRQDPADDVDEDWRLTIQEAKRKFQSGDRPGDDRLQE